MTGLKDRVRELRPVYLPPDPGSRTSHVAGEIAQSDLWFPPVATRASAAWLILEVPHVDGSAGTVSDGRLPIRKPRWCWSRGGSACIEPGRPGRY
jgi:hypothetical protein